MKYENNQLHVANFLNNQESKFSNGFSWVSRVSQRGTFWEGDAGWYKGEPLLVYPQFTLSLHHTNSAFAPLDNVCYLYNAPAGPSPCGAWPDVPAWLPPGLQDQQELGHHPPGHQGAAGHLQDGPAAGGHQLPLHPPHPLHLQPQWGGGGWGVWYRWEDLLLSLWPKDGGM